MQAPRIRHSLATGAVRVHRRAGSCTLRAKASDSKASFYEALGVGLGASQEAVKRAFRKLALRCDTRVSAGGFPVVLRRLAQAPPGRVELAGSSLRLSAHTGRLRQPASGWGRLSAALVAPALACTAAGAARSRGRQACVAAEQRARSSEQGGCSAPHQRPAGGPASPRTEAAAGETERRHLTTQQG